MSYRKLWIALVLVLVISFAVLGGVGINVMNNAPPIPSRVVTSDGRTLFDRGHHLGWPERMAVDRRPGSGDDLGTRFLHRPRLDGGLAAPRVSIHPGPVGQ